MVPARLPNGRVRNLGGATTCAVYLLTSNPRDSSVDVIKSAYEQALRFHQETFGASEAHTWLSHTSSITDVLTLVAMAEKKYKVAKLARWRLTSTVTSWWKLVSSRMMHYEKVIDTFVSSNPEYSALIWGAMKFLFAVSHFADR